MEAGLISEMVSHIGKLVSPIGPETGLFDSTPTRVPLTTKRYTNVYDFRVYSDNMTSVVTHAIMCFGKESLTMEVSYQRSGIRSYTYEYADPTFFDRVVDTLTSTDHK